jgi:DNA-binding transcriptional ArsR family regulator
MSTVADRIAGATRAKSAVGQPSRPLRGGDEPPGELSLTVILDAFSDPIRLRILEHLSDGEEHNCSSCTLPIAKSTTSHHFRVLREAGVITTRVDGKNRLNRLRREALDTTFPGLVDAILRANRA